MVQVVALLSTEVGAPKSALWRRAANAAPEMVQAAAFFSTAAPEMVQAAAPVKGTESL